MSITRASIASLLFAVLVAACGSAGPTASAEPTLAPPASGATASDSSPAPSVASFSRAPSASPTATPSATAVTSAGPGACTPDAPTSLSAAWTALHAHDGDFTFKYPGDWDRLYGAFVFQTSSLVDPTTYAETGLPATSETRADLVRAPGLGLPNASVLIVPGVTSDLPTIFGRQVARFTAVQTIQVISSTDTACIGGQTALGIRFTFNNPLPASPGASASPTTSPSGSGPPPVTYQESWYMVRSGRVYDFQWLAPAPARDADTAIFREMFRTWQWATDAPVATPASSGAASASASTGTGVGSSFVIAGMATNVDTAAPSADPKAFVTTIAKSAAAVYAVFSLKPGLSGTVNASLKQGDKILVSLTLEYGAKNTWGNFKISSSNGIAPGDYTMAITFAPTGETINLPFSVR